MYQSDTFAARPEISDSVDAWRAWCSDIHGSMRISLDDGSFRGSTARQSTDAYELVTWCSGEEVIARSRRDISTDERGRYELVVPLSGSQLVGTAETDTEIAPGAVALLPIDSPFRLAHHAGASAATLIVPAARLDDRVSGSLQGDGVRLLGDTGLARVCRDLIVSLHDSREHLSEAQFDQICERIVDLVSFLIAGDAQGPADTASDAVVGAVRRHVRDNATDPDLSVASMAREINWSPRYIQAVLARHGTTATELIRTERLELARSRLMSPAYAGSTVAAVGASVGFGSASAFAAAFRRHFGVTPRDVRTG